MIVTPQESTSLTNLLSSFNNENDNEKDVVKPNINMHIGTSLTQNTKNKNKRTVKKVRCKGRLVKKGDKFVPEVECTSDNIQVPKMEREQNRDKLLKVILGEVSKNKEENETMPFEENEHPLKVSVLPKKTKKPCGCRKKMQIDRTPPVELFPELSSNSGLQVDTNSNDNGEEPVVNSENNNSKKQVKKTRTRRKGKGNRSGKGSKHKIVTLTVKAGDKPKIPKVKVERKKKGSKKKRQGKTSKAN